MTPELSVLERSILKAKGLTDEHLQTLLALGIGGRDDFRTIGSVATLLELMPALDPETARKVMEWAVPPPAAPPVVAGEPGTGGAGAAGVAGNGGRVVLDTSDAVYCVHCSAKQPKDYHPGDLCPNCGKQAEPIETCYWCGTSGPGRFCRSCGATFVRTSELPLAMLLRRDGIAKDDIPRRLETMTEAEKESLWGRIRRNRV